MSVFLWHGAAMVLAWLVLVPAGVLIARFYKVRPGQDFPRHTDDRFWWDSHRILQIGGVALATLAAYWVFQEREWEIDWDVPHTTFGLIVLVLGAAQVLSPLLRGTKGGPTDDHADPANPATWHGDHFDMTLRRRIFEAWHKNVGYLVMLAAVLAVWTGIETAGLEEYWKWGVVALIALYIALFILWTRQRRRVDTWTAIWGPPGSLPRHHPE